MGILIVDDTRSIRSLMEFFLTSAGYGPILHAESGEAALDILGTDDPESATGDVELVLLDVVMPGMGGVETCRRIRAASHLGPVPVAMVTSDLTPATLEAVFQAGANEVVPKPLDRQTLLAAVGKLLGR